MAIDSCPSKNLLYVLFKALPSACMKYTACGEKPSIVLVMSLSPRTVYFHTNQVAML